MKLLELIFTFFSKPYVKFLKRRDDWFYLPILIISFILGFNVFIFSTLFFKINVYYILLLILVIYFYLIFLLGYIRKKGKQFIVNYKFSKYTLLIMVFVLLADFYSLVKVLNYSREKNIKNKVINKPKVDYSDYKYKK